MKLRNFSVVFIIGVILAQLSGSDEDGQWSENPVMETKHEILETDLKLIETWVEDGLFGEEWYNEQVLIINTEHEFLNEEELTNELSESGPGLRGEDPGIDPL